MHGATAHDKTAVISPAHEFLVVTAIDRFEGLTQLAGMVAAESLMNGLREDLSRLLGAGIKVERRSNHLEAVLKCGSAVQLADELAALGDALHRIIEIDGYRFERGVSIGATDLGGGLRPADARGAAQWALAQARIAQVPVIIPHSQATSVAEDRLQLMRNLQRAIREDRLDLHYQPKIHAREGGIAAAEGLIRWHCPDAGQISPDRFISIAEATGDIRGLTHWVIGRALRDLDTLSRRGESLRLDVNVSGTLLSDRRFTRDVIDQLAPAKGMIGIEITETAMIVDPDRALANLRLCAEAGLQLAIDDYGAGFSSLAYLQQLPLSELKIDKSFVLRLASGQRDPLLVRSTIDLAHALEMKVTAEGVETPQALALLQVMGCDLVQGFFLSRPLPLDKLFDYVTDSSLRARAPDEAIVRFRQRVDAARNRGQPAG